MMQRAQNLFSKIFRNPVNSLFLAFHQHRLVHVIGKYQDKGIEAAMLGKGTVPNQKLVDILAEERKVDPESTFAMLSDVLKTSLTPTYGPSLLNPPRGTASDGEPLLSREEALDTYSRNDTVRQRAIQALGSTTGVESDLALMSAFPHIRTQYNLERRGYPLRQRRVIDAIRSGARGSQEIAKTEIDFLKKLAKSEESTGTLNLK